MNGREDWSDQRGLNSLQLLTFLHVVIRLTGDPDGTYRKALADMSNSTNQYDLNVVRVLTNVTGLCAAPCRPSVVRWVAQGQHAVHVLVNTSGAFVCIVSLYSDK